MVMVIASVAALLGVVVGCESPLDSPWTMHDWNQGTQSSARRRR